MPAQTRQSALSFSSYHRHAFWKRVLKMLVNSIDILGPVAQGAALATKEVVVALIDNVRDKELAKSLLSVVYEGVDGEFVLDSSLSMMVSRTQEEKGQVRTPYCKCMGPCRHGAALTS